MNLKVLSLLIGGLATAGGTTAIVISQRQKTTNDSTLTPSQSPEDDSSQLQGKQIKSTSPVAPKSPSPSGENRLSETELAKSNNPSGTVA